METIAKETQPKEKQLIKPMAKGTQGKKGANNKSALWRQRDPVVVTCRGQLRKTSSNNDAGLLPVLLISFAVT